MNRNARDQATTGDRFDRRFVAFLARARCAQVRAAPRPGGGAAEVSAPADLVKAAGAVDFADWLVIRRMEDGEELHSLVTTTEREALETEARDAAGHDWCRRVRQATGGRWRYFRLNRADFYAVESEVSEFGELFAHSWLRKIRRFREKYLIRPMTHEEIKEAINEGRE